MAAASEATYLRVPYAEKDDAKKLGARWDPAAKSWYVPVGVELDAFERWWPKEWSSAQTNADASPAPEPASAPGEAPWRADSSNNAASTGVSLAELLSAVSQAVERAYPGAVWVRAEVSEIRGQAHRHIQLVDYDDAGREAAKAKAILFASNTGILERFRNETGQAVDAGVTVLLKVDVTLHSVYGLSLKVQDIDPSYTLGAMAARIRAIRQTLTDEGVIEANRSRPQPKDFAHVAVIAPEGAAGLGDFRTKADWLSAYGLCTFSYYTALFQGNDAGTSIRDAFARISRDYPDPATELDAIAVIRGGGDSAGLFHLNAIEAARAVVAAPVPVIVGIGHERDTTVLDELACIRCATPSMVATTIADAIAGNARQARSDINEMQRLVRASLHTARQEVERSRGLMRETVQAQLARARQGVTSDQQRLTATAGRAAQSARFRVEAEQRRLQETATRMTGQARANIERERDTLGRWPGWLLQKARMEVRAASAELLSADPNRVLGQGFALVRDSQGRSVRDSAAVSAGDELRISVARGTIPARATTHDSDATSE